MRGKALKSLIGLLISCILIGWIVYSVEWGEVAEQLYQMRYWAFLPCTLVFVLHYLLRAWRWRFLLADGQRIKTRELFDAIMVGAFASFILPLRAGEFIRPYLLSKRNDLRFSTSFISIVVERFFDLSVVLLTFGILVLWIDSIPAWAYAGAWSLSLLALAIFVFILVGSFIPKPLLGISKSILSLLPERLSSVILSFLKDFLEGAAILGHKGRLFKILVLSVLVWCFCYLLFYFFLYLFPIEATPLLGISVAVIVALAVAAPSAPGFIGVYQTGCIAGFALFGVDKELAVAYSIITHVYQYVIFVCYGIYVLSKYDLKLGDLQKAALRGNQE